MGSVAWVPPGWAGVHAVPTRRAGDHQMLSARAAAALATARRGWPVPPALRVVVLLAYQPALIFPDSERYLPYSQQYINGHWSPDWLRTSAYSLLLIPAVLIHNLVVVPLAQHLLGLATAVLIYAVLVHFGSRRWLAALATVPVLFDPLQLDIEQYVLTDVSATFLLAAALVVLVWKRGAIGQAGARGRRAAARRRHGHQAIRPDRDHPRRALPGGRRPALAPHRGAGVAAARRLPAPRARLPGLVPGDGRPVRLRQLRQRVHVRPDRAVCRLHRRVDARVRATPLPVAAAGPAQPRTSTRGRHDRRR